jgi:hypothetical protein
MSSTINQGGMQAGTQQSLADPGSDGNLSSDQVQVVKADGLRGSLGLFEVTTNGQTEFLTRQDLEQRNFQFGNVGGAPGGSLFFSPRDTPSSSTTTGVAANKTVAQAVPLTTRTAEQVRELAKWPDKAHAAWDKLTKLDRIAVFENMKKNYGEAFAKQFLEFTKKGARQDGAYYGPHFPEHPVPSWFTDRGFKLAQRDSTHDWWVHSNGYSITANRDTSPWRHTPDGPDTPPPPETPPKVPPPVDPPVVPPPHCADGDSTELMKITQQSIKDDIAEDNNRQDEAVAAKEKLDQMDVTSPEYKTAYDAYIHLMDESKSRIKDQLDSIADATTALKDMCADTKDIDKGRSEIEELQNWFDVTRSILDMEGRKPINVNVK